LDEGDFREGIWDRLQLEPGGKLLHFAGAGGETGTAQGSQMVFLSVVGNRVSASVLSDISTDTDQPDSTAVGNGTDGERAAEGARRYHAE